MKGKVIIAVTNDLSYDQRMIKTANTLVALGYAVKMVGRVRPNSIPLIQEGFEQFRLNCFFDKGKLFYLEFNIRLFFFLLNQAFDKIIAVDLDTIIPVYYAGKRRGARLYYDAHEYFTEVPELVHRPFVKKCWKWIERRFVPKFHYHYTVSTGLVHLFKNDYGIDFALIRNMPLKSNRSIHAFDDKKEKYILYQGSLNDGRGLEYMIRAMQSIEGIKLKLAGEGDLSQSLRNQVKSLHLEDKVQFLGYVKPTDLIEITAHAYMAVNLLENKGLNYYYSLANKFFDYVQWGVPSVNMNFPEYAAIIEKYHCGILLDDLNESSIAEIIHRLLNDKELYLTIQRNCLAAAESLIWENEAAVFTEKLDF